MRTQRKTYHEPIIRLSAVSEKMIFSILLLLILNSCVYASVFVVNVTQSSYQAEENHNVTLEWTFTSKPDSSITLLKCLCSLVTDRRVSVLYRVHDGVEVSESQHEQFAGRVQSDKDVLRDGRIRLHVSRLKTEDSGLYVCDVKTDYGFSSGRCQLNVSAVRMQPELERKPGTSNTGSRGRNGLHIIGILTYYVCFVLFTNSHSV
ncbi:uncharacterized protein [Leuresthes tenuis]|uniref:uncharacterized protein n=1 Tax=Leuresthes tenuis TaxID=355514 RepID=UPI003B50464D